MMIEFQCDYAEGAHPKILERLVETNMDQTPGYGLDPYCDEARRLIRKACGREDIDVQFLGRGTETIWYAPKEAKHVVVEDRSADDLLFYAEAGEKDCVNLAAGDFAVFFPWELHRPGCSLGAACEVQKIVVKVLAK